MNIYLLGKPLFVWFGILAGVSLLFTAYFGFKIAKFGIKLHKIFFYLTIIFVVLHLAFGGLSWIF